MKLNTFEKFLQGKKSYAVAILAIVYGVLESGFQQHHWTSFGGAWTWIFSAGGFAAFRAAFAVYAANMIAALTNTSTMSVGPTIVTPLGDKSFTTPIPPVQ